MKRLRQYCKNFFDKCELDSCTEIDKRCLNVALSRFLDSGKKEDAFDVYFCFAEIFKVFGNGYCENTRHLLEIICEYEMSAGTLVEKQRDHYSHSVFVFAIGLAIYERSSKYRRCFRNKTENVKRKIDEEFLYRWGLAALFHDIGYPFEIVFEQIKAYTQNVNEGGGYYPILTYKELNKFVAWEDKNINKELAAAVCKKLGLPFEIVLNKLNNLMDESNVYMDHAYFSAVMMYKNLIAHNDSSAVLDIAASILLHNSFLIWKLKDCFKKKLNPAEDPLTFLLMFCDELQDFGREGFGKVSKKDNLAFTAEFSINKDVFKIVYVYDETGAGKVQERKDGKIAKLSFYDTEKLFDKVVIEFEVRECDKPSTIYMSANFFRNIQKIAMQIHAFYLDDKREETLHETWDSLTLEYKLSNIAQAKSYAEKLNQYGYFYDDRNLHYETVTSFIPKQIDRLAIDEHNRWVKEKLGMGWKYGQPKDRAERDALRIHKDIVPYQKLDDNAKEKDRDAIRHLIGNLELAGFKIYKL